MLGDRVHQFLLLSRVFGVQEVYSGSPPIPALRPRMVQSASVKGWLLPTSCVGCADAPVELVAAVLLSLPLDVRLLGPRERL